MTNTVRSHPACWKVLTLLLLGFLLVGCSSTPKVDWDSRIGSYTYDQAVLDLGPPDKATTLEDGSTVAEWVTSSSAPRTSVGFGVGSGSYHRGYGTSAGVGVSTPVGSRQQSRRLTFDSNGLLQASKLIK